MKILPRHLFWVNLSLLALVAYWGAVTVNTAIAARLVPPPEVHLSEVPPPISQEPRRPASYYAAIHVRDIFNSTKPEPDKPPEPPKPTELKLRLWGVALHGDGSSYCVIEDLVTRKQELYKINDPVVGGARVKTIEWDRVILEREGGEEVLEIVPAPGGRSATAGRSGGLAHTVGGATVGGRAVGVRGAHPGGHSGGNPHIQQVSETQYNIDRSEVDAALENMGQLFTQIRAVPHFEGGRTSGFRLFAIRPNSIFDNIGLRNGDIIQRVNGAELTDPSRALSLFQQLRNEQQLTIEIVRNRETKTITYLVN